MRAPPVTHTLEKEGDDVLIPSLSESLALVDLDSYPAFIGKDADYFDLMAHLSRQMQALTAIAWKAPDQAAQARLILTGDDAFLERCRSGRIMIASGNVRCYGQMGLVSHHRLFNLARRRGRTLFSGGEDDHSQSQILRVPPGIYSIFIYYHSFLPYESGDKTEADYNVLLRHYPFPPPRVAPVRLGSGLLSSADEAPTRPAEGVISSHARIW